MRVNRLFYFLLFFLLTSQCLYSQKDVVVSVNREIRLDFPDSSIVFNVQNKISKVKVKEDRFYFWYSADKINVNQGGYSGRLLNGKYSVYDKAKRLKSVGFFKGGLKHGVWKTWNENGAVASNVKYEEGFLNGEAKYFDTNGNIKRVVPYKNNQINGYVIKYSGSKVEKIKYKNGQVVEGKNVSAKKENVKKEKGPSRFSKIFKRKQKPDETKSDSSSTDTTSTKKKPLRNIFKMKKDSKEQ